MKILSIVWSWLDGKKTILGVVGTFLTFGAEGMGWLPVDVASWLRGLFLTLGTVGVGHKLVKATK